MRTGEREFLDTRFRGYDSPEWIARCNGSSSRCSHFPRFRFAEGEGFQPSPDGDINDQLPILTLLREY